MDLISVVFGRDRDYGISLILDALLQLRWFAARGWTITPATHLFRLPRKFHATVVMHIPDVADTASTNACCVYTTSSHTA